MVKNAEEIYGGRSGIKNSIVKWFHNGRLRDFSAMMNETGGTALSVGCGSGHMERHLVDKFDVMYGIDPIKNRIKNASQHGLETIQATVPPIPFEDSDLDVIMAAGTIEHIEDERGFLEDTTRCLKPDGGLYLTIPIEVGLGGLLRYWGRCVTHADFHDSPNGLRRFWDFSLEELLKKTPRNKHDRKHRYFNYKYTLQDLNRLYNNVSVTGWPIRFTGSVNLILFAKATGPDMS